MASPVPPPSTVVGVRGSLRLALATGRRRRTRRPAPRGRDRHPRHGLAGHGDVRSDSSLTWPIGRARRESSWTWTPPAARPPPPTTSSRPILDHATAFPIAAFVHDHALGPGSLIAVACKTLALSPGASLGERADQRSKSEFQAAADANHRNPAIAAAFVSADADLPALGVKAGDSLTLTTGTGPVGGLRRPGRFLPLRPARQDGAGPRTGGGAAFDGGTLPVAWPPPCGSPSHGQRSCCWRVGLALDLGIEMLTLHTWGLAGIAGGVLVALIFAAYITVGAATWVGVLLFLGGCALLLLETHVLPGHGWPALTGLALIFVGLFYALGGSQAGALYPAATALCVTVALLVAFFLYLPRSGVWKRLGQPMRQTALVRVCVQRRLHRLPGPARRHRDPPAPVRHSGVRRRPPPRRLRRRVRAPRNPRPGRHRAGQPHRRPARIVASL